MSATYNITIDYVNGANNSSDISYPLVQGTDVQFDVKLVNDGSAISLTDEEVSAFIVSYDKLDAGYTIISGSPNLTITTHTGESTGADVTITGTGLTSNANTCDLILKVGDVYTTPFKFYVKSNPAYLYESIEDNNE